VLETGKEMVPGRYESMLGFSPTIDSFSFQGEKFMSQLLRQKIRLMNSPYRKIIGSGFLVPKVYFGTEEIHQLFYLPWNPGIISIFKMRFPGIPGYNPFFPLHVYDPLIYF
jgi:hypothetical protein